MTPDVDLATLVAGHVTGCSVLGTDVFTGPEDSADTSIPAKATFFVSYSSLPPDDFLGTGNHRVETAFVQCVCRGNPQDRGEPLTRARAVAAYLHRNPPTGYVMVTAEQTEPTDLGPNGRGCHRQTINFQVKKEV